MNLNDFEPESESPIEGLLKAQFTGLYPELFIQWKGSHEFVVLTKFQYADAAGPRTKSHCI